MTDGMLAVAGVIAVTFAVGLQYGRGELFGLDGRSEASPSRVDTERIGVQFPASTGRPSSPRRIEGIDVQGWHARAVRNRRTINRLRQRLAGPLEHTIQLVFAFECIHQHEGSWTDDGSPYWGGLQMDYDFQRTYGRRLLTARGTANNWTPAQQIRVAITAHAERGFGPWPKTRTYCGV